MKLFTQAFYSLLAASLLVSQTSLAKVNSSLAAVNISCGAINDSVNPNLSGLKASKMEFSKNTAVYEFHFKPIFQDRKKASISYVSLQSALPKPGERPIKMLFLKEKIFNMAALPNTKRSYTYRGKNILEAKFALKKSTQQTEVDFYKSEDFEGDEFNGLNNPNYIMTVQVDEGQNFNDLRKPHPAVATLTVPARKDDIGRVLSEARDIAHFRCKVRGI